MSAQCSLIFGESGDIELPVRLLRSKCQGDMAKVILTHHAIGVILKEADPKEKYIHVELFDDDKTAELWLSFEWAISNARAKIKAQQSMEDREKYSTLTEVTKVLIAQMPPFQAEDLAKEIVNHYKTNNLDALIKHLKLADLLNK